jgi:hypothetical protein
MMTLESAWLKVMLEEIERKRRDDREAREEAERRARPENAKAERR